MTFTWLSCPSTWDLHFRHKSELPVCRTPGIEPGSLFIRTCTKKHVYMVFVGFALYMWHFNILICGRVDQIKYK